MLTAERSMAGERHQPRERVPAQPGGRPPAPGSLALVQAFINTHFDLERDHGAEVLASVAALADWLRERRLIDPRAQVRDGDLRRALALRESLRMLARTHDSDARGARRAREQIDAAAAGARIEVRFAPDGPNFIGAADAGVDGAFGAMLAIVAGSISDGSWSRLKICPGHDCGWAFYDHSRNRSGRWCSMAVCGGREKARAHYRRRRTEGR
jgi:predicted RNA-binding Zn ribbon-like protein